MKPCKIFSWIFPYLISEGRRNISCFFIIIYYNISKCHSAETVTKCVTEYVQIWKWMVEFLSKFQGRGIKIYRVNSIRLAKQFIFFNIFGAVAR